MVKIKDGEVRPEGCMCEPRSDIPPNWNDIRTKFGYIMLSEIAGDGRKILEMKTEGCHDGW